MTKRTMKRRFVPDSQIVEKADDVLGTKSSKKGKVENQKISNRRNSTKHEASQIRKSKAAKASPGGTNTKGTKEGRVENQKISNRRHPVKHDVNQIRKSKSAPVSQAVPDTRGRKKTVNKQTRPLKTVKKRKYENSNENIENLTSNMNLDAGIETSDEQDSCQEKQKNGTDDDIKSNKTITSKKSVKQGSECGNKTVQTVTRDRKCSDCDILFSSKQEYGLHTCFLCKYCNMRFETKLSLEEHLKELHINVESNERKSRSKIYKCTVEGCLKKFTSEIYCQKHVSKYHLTFKCEFCGLIFEQRELLGSHLNSIHKKEAPTSQFLKNSELPVRYKCSYKGCDKDFGNTSNRKKHINSVHLDIRNYHCEYCAFRFKTSSALKNHIAVLHTKDADKKLFECDVCNKAFPRKASLKLHESLHSNIKSYICTFEGCGKSFRLSTTLDKHRKVHSDEKPFHCFICEERFTRRIYRDTHMYKHTGKKNYSCDICHKTFSQKGNLTTHQLIHSNERPIYKCPECSQVFNFKSNMKKHLEKHATEQSLPDKRGNGKRSAKPKLFVVNPVRSAQIDKHREKVLEQVNASSVISEVNKVENNAVRKIAPLKATSKRDISALPAEKAKTAHDRQGKTNIMLDRDNLSETQQNKGGKESSNSKQPIYVRIEKIKQHDSNGSEKDKRESSIAKDFGVKFDSSVRNKPTFTIKFNNDSVPVARLQGTDLAVSSDMSNNNLSVSEDSTNEMEQSLMDVIEESSDTNVECKMESPIHTDVSEQIVSDSEGSDSESAVLEQIVNAIEQVRNDKNEIVETTVEELTDSVLQAENSNVILDGTGSYSFPNILK